MITFLLLFYCAFSFFYVAGVINEEVNALTKDPKRVKPSTSLMILTLAFSFIMMPFIMGIALNKDN